MTEENVEIVRRMLRAFGDGDYETSLTAFHPEAEFDVTIRPEGRVYRGHAGIVQAVRTWTGTWEDYTSEIEELVDCGEHVLVVDRQTGRGRGSGIPLDEQTYWVYTLRDGLILRVKWFVSREEALEVAGLSE